MPDEPKNYETVDEVSEEPWVPLPKDEWTEPERWVWERVRTGRVADFNERYGETLDPKNEEVWNEEEKKKRGLRGDYLRTVLLCDPWRSIIPHQGVKILGAWYGDDIILGNAVVGHEIWLEHSLFSGKLELSLAVFEFILSLEGSCLRQKLNLFQTSIKGSLYLTQAELQEELAMGEASVKGSLFMRQGRFKDARMLVVRVGSDISLTEAQFQKKLAMDGAEVKGSLFMRKGRFQDARLHGVQVGGVIAMEGAEFQEELAMDGAEVKGSLFMRKGRFQDARLHGVQVGGQLDMEGAEFQGKLAMDGAVIKGNLFMRKSRFKDTHLPGVWVGGQLDMRGAEFQGKLAMDRAKVKASLFMRQGKFKDARLPGVRVGGSITMEGAEFQGKLAMNGADVEGDLFMTKGRFKDAHLHGVQVGGVISMEGAEFQEKLAMDRAVVKGTLFMTKGRFKDARLPGVRVGGSITMEGAQFEESVIMQRTRVEEDLHLREARFKGAAELCFASVGGHVLCEGTELESLNLSDTKVDAFYDGRLRGDEKDSWPDDLNLDRFTYNHLRGSGDLLRSEDMTDRPVKWFVGWLKRSKPFSPQPYQQCAKVLREAGQSWKASEILFAGKDRERENSVWYRKAWLELLKWSVGYGLGWRFKVLPTAWAFGVLLAGAIVCFYSPNPSSPPGLVSDIHSFGWCLGLSLDRLLPLVQLSKDYTDFVFHGWQRAWFIGQAVFGWGLASLIIAGLAGVGKPGGRES